MGMNRAEVEVLLKTIYSGEGASKAIGDLDKISASGQKVAGSLRMAKKEAAEVFSGVSESTRRRNPQLFQNTASGGGGNTPAPPTSSSPSATPLEPGGGGGKRPYGGLGQFGYRFAASFGVGRAAALGGVAGLAGAAAAMALKKIFELIAGAAKRMIEAFDNARRVYAQSLQSGLGIAATVRRNSLASVLGVSEKDIYQFGASILAISPKLQFANDIMSKTTRNLTSVGWEFKILSRNLEALFADIANDAAPAFRKFTSGLSEITKETTSFYEAHQKGIAMLSKILLEFATIIPINEIAKLISSKGKDTGPAPQPLAFMKQIQASSWERMGLVIGGGGAANPAQETARNTKATAEGVKQLIKINGGKASFGDPFMGAQSYL